MKRVILATSEPEGQESYGHLTIADALNRARVPFWTKAATVRSSTELDAVLGAEETLKYTNFVIAEVRHNHESLNGVYKLHEFINLMTKNKFILTRIFTAKPFIADLCFEPIK